MKRKLLSLLLTCAMVLSMLPVGVLAAGENATEIGTADELETALAATTGTDTANIKLTADIDFTSQTDHLRAARNATIDFSGYTLNLGNHYFRIENGITLAITDTAATAGKITGAHNTTTLIPMRGGSLTLEKVQVENTGAGYGIMVNPSPRVEGKLQTNVTLRNATVTASEGCVYVHGNIKESTDLQEGNYPVLNLSNVTLTAKEEEGAGIYLAGMAKTTVDSCNISSEKGFGIGIKSGTLEIKGTSKVSGQGTFNELPDANGNGINSDGSALLLENHSGYAGNVKVTIEEGAELTSKNGHAIREFTGEDGTANTNKPQITITGGTFTSPAGKEPILVSDHSDSNKIITISGGTFSGQIETDYFKEGYSTVTGPDGSVTVKPPEPETKPQIINTRTTGPEDNDPTANYAEAYRTAGVTLEAQAADGSYTLTVDKAKLNAVFAAGTAETPDTNSDLYKAYQIMENDNNPKRLWFGAEYPAPTVNSGTITKALVQFDGEGDFSDVPLEAMTSPSGGKGFFNYIKLYDGKDGATVPGIQREGETALIKWLDNSDNVLAKTKAEIKIAFKKYTVTFDSDGGTEISTQSVDYEGKATKPADPTKTNFAFAGWYLTTGDQPSNEAFDFETPVTGDITLKAKWVPQYTVTFDSDGGSDVAPITIDSEGTITEPTAPTKRGYSFVGWYKVTGDQIAENKFDFSTKITENIKLKAKWVVQYTVTFDSDGGSAVTAQPVVSGGNATKPADPTKEGYDFVDWYEFSNNQMADEPFNFGTAITGDITLKAKWKPKPRPDGQVTITFDKNCDDEVTGTLTPVSTVDGKVPKYELPSPKRTGYIFDGWYQEKDKDGNVSGEKVTYDTKFPEDETVHAKWTIRDDTIPEEPVNEFTVTFNTQGGSSVESVTVKKDAVVPKPESNPTRDGYTFKGWYKDGDGQEAWDFEKDAVTEETVIYAVWTKIPTPGDDNYEYHVWIRYGSRHGDIYASRRYAEKGETVTLTIDPDSDYQLEWLEISQDSGGLVNWERNGREYTFTMPASDVTVDAGFDLRTVHYDSATDRNASGQTQKPAVVPVFTPPDQRPAIAAADVSWGSWAYPSAQWAYQNGYLDLNADGTFRLDDPVAHQQMWKIMAQWLGEPAATEREITGWASKIGAGKGSSPTGSMTRQDMVAYLYQCYFLMGGDVSSTGNLAAYPDSRLIPPASQKAWTWAVEKGLISGTADGSLSPNKTLSRGEFAAILMRLCQQMKG